ncbi:MAG: hypothetical protein R2737_12755 [Candidatus Nanopelagicales bacterium]
MSGPAGGLPIVLAVGGLVHESALVAACTARGTGLTVVRRAVDAVDAVGAAGAGGAAAVVLSAQLPRLSADTVHRLRTAGVAVVGVADDGDEAADRRLLRLDVPRVVTVRRGAAAEAAAAIGAAIGDLRAQGGPARATAGYADPRQSQRPHPRSPAGPASARPRTGGTDGPGPDVHEPEAAATPSSLVAVWGPTGAPGRTSVALGLADELARAGTPALLVDADPYGGAVAACLGIHDEASGLAVACRQADQGALDVPALARAARGLSGRLRVLTGIGHPERWVELRPSALESLWRTCGHTPGVTVVDTGFCLEADEELAYDTLAPRRNAATLTALQAADTVVAVGAADPVGVARLLSALPDLRARVPDTPVRVVLTRVRRGPLGADPAGQLRTALARHAGVDDVVLVPDDRNAYDTCLREGRTLAEAVPRSTARAALRELASGLIDELARPAPPGPGAAGARRSRRRGVRAGRRAVA